MEKWQDPKTIILWIVIAIIFFLVLFSVIILLVRVIFKKIIKTKLAESKAKLKHQQSLLETTILTQEKERKRIAEDIHDELIGKLSVIKLQYEINQNQNTESIKLIDDSIHTARRISHDLSPPLLEFSSLSSLIGEIINPWEKKLQIDSIFDIRDGVTHSNQFKIQLIRITQEIITNINKHANATNIKLHYRETTKFTLLKISDNGDGYNLNEVKAGLGLNNIETRIQYLKGKYKIISELNKGTSILLVLQNNLKETNE